MREVTAIAASLSNSRCPWPLVTIVVRCRRSEARGTRKRRKEPHVVAYVIAEPCIDTKDNSCVEVCPVDCIHPTPDEPDYDNVKQLFIDPDECIDCDACVEACPVDACFAEDQLPDEWQSFIEVNAAYYKKG
jgi:ferredoxin